MTIEYGDKAESKSFELTAYTPINQSTVIKIGKEI